MKKIHEVFIHMSKELWETDYGVSVHNCDMSNYGYFLIDKTTIEVNVPAEEVINKLHIENLRKKEQKLKADFHVAQEKIKEEIQSLLAITNKS
jgi:hypothetical protein